MKLFTILISVLISVSAVAGQSNFDYCRKTDMRKQKILELTAVKEYSGQRYYYSQIAAKLTLGQDVDKCRADFLYQIKHPTGNMFFGLPMMACYLYGYKYWDEEINDAVKNVWRTYLPGRGDTENHWLLHYGAQLLAAQQWPDKTDKEWANGKTTEENYKDAYDYINKWIDWTTTIGTGEFDSPTYLQTYAGALLVLYDFVKDSYLKQRIKMILDWTLADYAIDYLGGAYTGGHSRVYDRDILHPGREGGDVFGYIYFGDASLPVDCPELGFAVYASMSSYNMPQIIKEIATDRSKPYMAYERRRVRNIIRYSDIKNPPVYNDNISKTRSELEDSLLTIINNRNPKISKGLNKVLLDNSVFDTVLNEDIEQNRAEIFKTSSNSIKQLTTVSSFEEYREQVIQQLQDKILSNNLYSDLPEYDIFTGFKRNFDQVSLLNRYNCVLVQSLLLYSGQLELVMQSPDPRELRGIFRYLKFFRLLATIHKTGNNYKMFIDGPASVFNNSQKYGLQLASFFPVLCFLKNWKLTAEVKIKNRNLKLSVSEKDNLKSHYKTPSSYIPEEIKIFEKYFNEKSENWKIIESKDFIDTGDQKLIFPDLTFQKGIEGKLIFMELFHRWHKTQLLERLNFLRENNNLSFIIGIDRFIYKDSEVKSLIESVSDLKNLTMLFNDFPGVNNTLKLLNKI